MEIITRSRQDVDGMDGDGGDAVVDDEDRCLSLLDLRKAKIDPWWMSSPSRCLPEVRFWRFLGVLYVVSSNQLHRVKLFDEAEAAYTAGAIRPKKLLPSYSCSFDSLPPLFASGFLPVLLIFPK